MLFPQIGEIIGGSVREESYDKLMAEIEASPDSYEGYGVVSRHPSLWHCPHGGFGLGFERLILFVTGMQNIRDVIPFPKLIPTSLSVYPEQTLAIVFEIDLLHCSLEHSYQVSVL